MRSLVNSTLKWYLGVRYKKLEHAVKHPHATQFDLLQDLLYTAVDTEVGRRYDFETIGRYENFRDRLPVLEYDDIRGDIRRMMLGKRDVLWPGVVNWFAKSSGTTDKSKFVPVTRQCLKDCHIKGFWDTIAILYNNHPEAKIFEYKNLIVGGTLYDFAENPNTRYGDVSAILIHEMPLVGRPFYAPDFETASLKKWDEKLERTAMLASREAEIGSVGGVPTWNLVLFKRVLELTGCDHLLEVWPHLQVYLHGGVNFDPYRAQFKQLIPSEKFIYQEVYNASEGYFATQDDYKNNDLLLLPDGGVFYEFVPLDSLAQASQSAVPLGGVEPGKQYAMVITTNAGLWRYMLGDTVMFTNTDPYKYVITGRTKHFINAFGEEVMVANTDLAIARTCKLLHAGIRDYTVAPVYMKNGHQGYHQWVIEFEKLPHDLRAFSAVLDRMLQDINSDYEAKRYHDLALRQLEIVPAPLGTFEQWLQAKGKVGAQIKVPRLANNRSVIDEILDQLKRSESYQSANES